MVALYQLFVCYCRAVKVLNQRISWHLFFIIQMIQVQLQKLSLLCHCPQLNQIFTNFYNSSVIRSPADSKITRWTPLFQRKSQVELKCKLAIRRSDDNYSLDGLFSQLNSVFTHIYTYMVSQRVQVIHTGSQYTWEISTLSKAFQKSTKRIQLIWSTLFW